MLTIPKRYLTDDEVIELTDKKGRDHSYRVRIWRGERATPIVLTGVLLSPEGKRASGLMTSKLANFVMETMLGHSIHSMLYFEDEEIPAGVPALSKSTSSITGTRTGSGCSSRSPRTARGNTSRASSGGRSNGKVGYAFLTIPHTWERAWHAREHRSHGPISSPGRRHGQRSGNYRTDSDRPSMWRNR